LAQLPSNDYPTDRYFKVAFESDAMSVANEDMYLDLARSDGQDAPLVKFEIPLGPDDEIEDEPLSLPERIISQVFWILDVARTKYAGSILVFGEESSWNGQRTKNHATRLLLERGFSATLPELPRVACLRRGPVSVLIEVSDELELVGFKFGGESSEATESFAQELLTGVPGAEMKKPIVLRSESSN
jgi:hypothetical protein